MHAIQNKLADGSPQTPPNLILKTIISKILLIALFATSAHASVVGTDPNLPVTSERGYYATPTSSFATYNGPGLSIVLTDVQLTAVQGTVSSNPSGSDEIENFTLTMTGNISVNSSPFQSFSGSGTSQTIALGKFGNTTGTFNTEMLSLNISANTPFGPFLIRESPTLPSPGLSTVTDIGGGLYQIDSFFDVFTELSIDGGQSWIPSASGAAHVDAVPEPHTVLLLACGACGCFAIRRRRQAVELPR